MGILQTLSGMICFEMISADAAGALREITASGISLYDVQQCGDLTVHACVRRHQYKKVEALAAKRGETVKILKRKGLYWIGACLVRRPVMLIVLALFLLLVLFLPTRILFIQVEGNVQIPTNLILEQAAGCGICFGASRRDVRSEKMKNALLAAVPDIQWAGVNTRGCVATIRVREKSTAQIQENTQSAVTSIVAIRDGVIDSCSATSGNLLCKPGQAVKAGEILISGYTDCGITIQATQAKGEIFAQTQRELTVITPADTAIRWELTREETRYSLKIGKKLINFYKDSGILDTTCVKMYAVEYLALPGGFQLPVALVTEKYTHYQTQSVSLEQSSVEWLTEFSRDYLSKQMIAGSIHSEDVHIQQYDGIYELWGAYACREMIGYTRNEAILQQNGKDS